MLYFFYILLALLISLGSWLLEGGEIGALLQAPAMIFTLIPPLFFAIAATSWRAFALSWKLVFHHQAQTSPKEVEQACVYLKVFGYTSLFQGLIGTIMGAIATLASAGGFTVDVVMSELMHHMGAAMIALLWGMTLKMLCHVAEQRIRSGYLSQAS